jgi:hypothetical protein
LRHRALFLVRRTVCKKLQEFLFRGILVRRRLFLGARHEHFDEIPGMGTIHAVVDRTS